MPIDPNLEFVRTARADLGSARATLVQRIMEREQKQDKLRERQRSGTPQEIAAAQTELATAVSNYFDARSQEASWKTQLSNAIGNWLADHDPDQDLQRLSSESPIIFFPVRVETRFDLPNNRLLLRIYPDEIFVNIHERALTPEEIQAGKDFYTGRNIEDPATEREPWRRLVERFGVKRAAFIARRMRPTFDAYSSSDYPAQPIFPDPPKRPSTWTRPGEAILPDRWVVRLYPHNGTPRTIVGGQVREPLALTVDPGASMADVETLADGFSIDKDLAWTVEFQRAVEAGMALSINLLNNEPTVGETGGFDRIIVFGVKSSMPPIDTAEMLERLFDAQHYTNGMSFVAQGTPTNNTVDRPAPSDPPDRTAELSFAVERNPPPTDPELSFDVGASSDLNFDRLAEAFGMPNGLFVNMHDAGLAEQRVAFCMNELMWPVTLGYFMEQLMAPVFSETDIQAARKYFANNVHGCGNIPAFRVEDVPYGVLPVLSLERWGPRDGGLEEPLETKMIDTLCRLRQIWRRDNGPRIAPPRPRIIGAPPPAPPLDPALRVLAQDASSRAFRVRSGQGMLTLLQAAMITRQVVTDVFINRITLSDPMMAEIGHPEWHPRITGVTFESGSSRFEGHLVAPKPDDQADYLRTLPHLSLDQLRDLDTTGQPLLFLLVRHALMNEYGRIARKAASQNPAIAALGTEREVWNGKANTSPTTTLFQAFEQDVSATELIKVKDKVFQHSERAQYLNNLSLIDRAPAEQLERLMTETLDVCSHRLDAWISALAARRLLQLRRNQDGEENPRLRESLFGGYAFLNDVRPKARTMTTSPVGPAELAPQNGGYIHAPSTAHARAAAVLRSGYLAHRDEDPKKYALDLSSERVRRAEGLLDEVRQGIPLSVALGYRFERAVHETGDKTLERFLIRLRELYPPVANKAGDDPGAAAAIDRVAALTTVDGQTLLKAHNATVAADQIPWEADSRLPDPGSPAFLTLKSKLDALNELFDAVSDALTAESMFQLARGNVTGAQAAADALANGARPPELAVSRSPHDGIAVTHRVALVFAGGTAPALPAHWPSTAGPRATAEPFLDGWLGQLLADPDRVRAFVKFKEGNADHREEVKLSDLGLRPLDLLALARTSVEKTTGSALERRLIAQKLGGDRTDFSVDYSGVTAPQISLPQALTLVRSLAALLGKSRPLEAADLVAPSEVKLDPDAETKAQAGATELLTRARAALTSLKQARDGLSAAPPSQDRLPLLISAARFVPDLYPEPRLSGDAVQPAVDVAVAALTALVDKAQPISDRTATGSAATLGQANELLQAVFGADFVALASVGTPPGSAEMMRSLAGQNVLLALNTDAPAQVLQQAARLRERMARWRKLNLCARTLGGVGARVEVAQIPFVEGESWMGGPLGESPPERGRLSLMLMSLKTAAALNATQPWRGLAVDDWVEQIPAASDTTGLSFHYDGPNAEAGNAILVAVPSSNTYTWSLDEVVGTLEETFDLVELRSVDPEVLSLGQLLPAIFLAANVEDATPSTTFEGSLANDNVVISV